MLTLYTKPNCAFSAMVIKKMEDLGLSFEERNILDVKFAEELLEKGGKIQTPYFAEMYESSDILKHLEEHYGNEAREGGSRSEEPMPAIRLHRSDDADLCDACQ
jgi:glutathione S-transferase